MSAVTGTLPIALFHYLLRTVLGLAAAWPLGQISASQFDVIQVVADLTGKIVVWTFGSLLLAGLILAPWTNLAISFTLAHRCSIATGFARTSSRYLDDVCISLILLFFGLVIGLGLLCLGYGFHLLLDELCNPRVHDLTLVAVACILGVGAIGGSSLWHDMARSRLVLSTQPWLVEFRTAAKQMMDGRVCRPYAAWFCLSLLLILGAMALASADEVNSTALIACQQCLLFGHSVCRVARIKATLTNIDLDP